VLFILYLMYSCSSFARCLQAGKLIAFEASILLGCQTLCLLVQGQALRDCWLEPEVTSFRSHSFCDPVSHPRRPETLLSSLFLRIFQCKKFTSKGNVT